MIFLTTAMVVLVACMSPGPDFFIVTRTAIAQGMRAGFFSALGVAAGCFVYGTLAVLGLDFVFREFAGLALAVRILGGLYLAWLAVQVWQSAQVCLPVTDAASVASARSAFQSGLFTNLTNPKAIAFFSSVFAFALTPDTSLLTKAGLAVVAGIVALLWFSFVSFVLSRPVARHRYTATKPLIDRFCAAVMGTFGLKLIWSAVR